MVHKISNDFLYWIDGISTKITYWYWHMLYSDRKKGYGKKRRRQNA